MLVYPPVSLSREEVRKGAGRARRMQETAALTVEHHHHLDRSGGGAMGWSQTHAR
jgi:hypothetical protein